MADAVQISHSAMPRRGRNVHANHRARIAGGALFPPTHAHVQVIYDMDNYTRAWMHENAGLSPTELQPIHIDFDMGPKRPPIQ
eukprot:1159990-Pelagomonas_calceolata.AAC.12